MAMITPGSNSSITLSSAGPCVFTRFAVVLGPLEMDCAGTNQI